MNTKHTYGAVLGVLLCILTLSTPLSANDIRSIKLPQNNALGPRCITRTTDKTIHVVYWIKQGNSSKLYYINSKDEGLTWAPSFLLSQNYDDSWHATLTSDDAGRLYVFWADAGKILYTITPDNGRTWSPIYKVNGKAEPADMPSVMVSRAGNIHVVFESNGDIQYRMFSAKDNAWSALYNVSQTGGTSKTPQLTVGRNELVGIIWNEDGEITYRELVPSSNSWSTPTFISREAESAYGLTKRTNLNPQLLVDTKDQMHAIWGNGSKIIHRVKVKDYWSPAPSLVGREAMQWFGAPAVAIDQQNSLYCIWIEKGRITYKKYDGQRGTWDMLETTPGNIPPGFQAAPAMGPAWAPQITQPQNGFDLIFVQRQGLESKDYSLGFYTNATFAAPAQAPVITAVAMNAGRFEASWQPAADQLYYQVIVSNMASPAPPYLYDSGIVEGSMTMCQTKAFPIKDSEIYLLVRTADRKGTWSEWSTPYLYKASAQQSANGPRITLKGIEENSLYLYSPSPNVIYFGNGLDTPKTFTIMGSIVGKSSGVKTISFSRFGTNNPPPIQDPTGADFEVQYSVQSSDLSGVISIIATDYNGNTSEATVQVIKDSNPPQPPTWVRLSPDKEAHDQFVGKKSRKNKIYVYWTDGTDNESGIRYHVMGINPQWWKDSVHRSSDAEIGNEGDNTFYVFAIDNVGNVSVPGTDKVFIDTVAPFPPKLISTLTSSNMIYGIKSPDTTEVLVDGLQAKVELTSSTNWKYTTTLAENGTQTFSLQAKDEMGNTSEIITVNVRRKSTPPQLTSVSHEASPIVRGNDVILIKIKGEPFCFASAAIPPLAYDVQLYDDGTNGDAKKNDGEYTARFIIPADAPNCEVRITGILTDEAGNTTQKADPEKVRVNPSAVIILDDYETAGNVYPWMNHVKARNIDATEEKNLQLPGSTGVCKVEYDLNGVQNWAGFASREFLPKNCSGPSPKLQFLVKGSGDRNAKGAIRLRTRVSDWSKEIKEFPSSEYTFSLSNKDWQEISIPLPSDTIDGIDQVTQYSVLIYTPENKAKGTFYLDNLRITYKDSPRIQETIQSTTTPIRRPPQVQPPVTPEHTQPDNLPAPGFSAPSVPVPAEDVTLANIPAGSFIPAPYLSVIFHPNPMRAGSPIQVKVEVPAKYKAKEAALLLFDQGQKLISCKLSDSKNGWWHGASSVPVYIKPGSYFGTLFIKTGTGHFLKTRFPFQVIAQEGSTPLDLATVIFYPHPIVPGMGSTVKALIPRTLQARKVALFFGESNGKPMSTELTIKNISGSTEYWMGTMSLPGDMQPGDYSALLYIKNRTGQLYKKQIKYSVLKN